MISSYKFLYRLLYDCENVALFDDGKFFAVDLEIRTRVFGAENFIADFDLHDDLFAVHDAAGADCDDYSRLGLFLCRRGEKKAALRLFFDGNRFYDDLVE